MAEKIRKLAALMGKIDMVAPSFLKEPKHYVLQSLLAIIAVYETCSRILSKMFAVYQVASNYISPV